MAGQILLTNDSSLIEFCKTLGLSSASISKIQKAKKLQTLSDNLEEGSLTYIESKNLLTDRHILKGVFALVRENYSSAQECSTIIVENPSVVFWSLYEFIERSKHYEDASEINSNCVVGNNASIATLGVIIESDVVIEDNVVIKAGVVIKRGAKIGPGCVIGSNGLEVKETIFGKILISHKGGVVIDENVELGALCTINQGLGEHATKIGANTKVDSGVHIAHSCSIGSDNIIAANVTFGGSVVTGKKVFIGLNATIRNGITLANECFVGASSFVAESYKIPVKITPRAAKPLPLY